MEVSAGKAPDMSHPDAGLCPFMERGEVEGGWGSNQRRDSSSHERGLAEGYPGYAGANFRPGAQEYARGPHPHSPKDIQSHKLKLQDLSGALLRTGRYSDLRNGVKN
eukprot:scaffold10089_cov110-Isochrysis_galbana.AAC.10